MNTFVGDSMGAQLATVIVCDDAVSLFVVSAKPRPARIGLALFVELKEALVECASARCVAASPRTEQRLLTHYRPKLTMCTEAAVGSALCTEAAAAFIARRVRAIDMAATTG